MRSLLAILFVLVAGLVAFRSFDTAAAPPDADGAGAHATAVGTAPAVSTEGTLESPIESDEALPGERQRSLVLDQTAMPGVFGIAVDHVHEQPSDAVQSLETNPRPLETILSIGSLYLQGNVLCALGLDGQEALSVRAKV